MNVNATRKLFWLVASLLILTALLTACAPSEPEITVKEAWGRPSPIEATNGAFYMIIENEGGADRLVSVSSDACGVVELHESVMDSNGVMSMHPLEDGIEIPAGKTVELKPGGMHIMCIEKKAEFVPGTELTLSLEFEQSGTVIQGIEIREP